MTTRELCRYVGISLRQAQWWCEHGILKAKADSRFRTEYRREFDEGEARRALIFASLRRKGMSLQQIHKLRFRAEISAKYFVTDGSKILCSNQEAEVVAWIAARGKHCYVVRVEPRGGRVI